MDRRHTASGLLVNVFEGLNRSNNLRHIARKATECRADGVITTLTQNSESIRDVCRPREVEGAMSTLKVQNTKLQVVAIEEWLEAVLTALPCLGC